MSARWRCQRPHKQRYVFSSLAAIGRDIELQRPAARRLITGSKLARVKRVTRDELGSGSSGERSRFDEVRATAGHVTSRDIRASGLEGEGEGGVGQTTRSSSGD